VTPTLARLFHCLPHPPGVTLTPTALRWGEPMVGETISHYKVLEKIDEAIEQLSDGPSVVSPAARMTI